MYVSAIQSWISVRFRQYFRLAPLDEILRCTIKNGMPFGQRSLVMIRIIIISQNPTLKLLVPYQRRFSYGTSQYRSMLCIGGFFYLVGCPVGLEPTVSRSTIWRVNRLRYGHHIDAPEGTRTPGPLLRRQLLYPPELRAHVVIPFGSDMVCSCESKHAARSIIP